MIALSVPLILLIIIGNLIIYFRYIAKLKNSHESTYVLLTVCISIISILLVGFSIAIGLYFENPNTAKNLLYYSIIPYYIALFIVIGLYISLSPGFVVNSQAASSDMLIRKEIKQM